MANNYTQFCIGIDGFSEETLQYALGLWEAAQEIADEGFRSDDEDEEDETAARAEALNVPEAVIKEAEQLVEATSAEYWENRLDREQDTLYVYADESANIEQAVAFLRMVLNHANDDRVLAIQWADSCSKPRPDEFGGGAVVFSRHGEKWLTTYEWTGKMLKGLADGTEKF